uniref:Uncharacterized protein n=1 Tax=Denticeps clupeoides TaxID=299321 RepID=A0AAY4EEU9_9TELE
IFNKLNKHKRMLLFLLRPRDPCSVGSPGKCTVPISLSFDVWVQRYKLNTRRPFGGVSAQQHEFISPRG